MDTTTRSGNRETGREVVARAGSNKARSMAAHQALRVEMLAPAVVHWSIDGWRTPHDTASYDTTLGVHVVDVPTARLGRGDRVDFTFYWPESTRWEGTDFFVCVE